MTKLSKNIKFTSQFKPRLRGALSELVLQSQPFMDLPQIQQFVNTCKQQNINPINIQGKDIDFEEYVGTAELLTPDIIHGHHHGAISTVIGKTLAVLMSKTEGSCLESFDAIQKDLEDSVLLSKKNKTTIVTLNITPWSIYPFVRFRLMPSMTELLKIKFRLAFTVGIKDLPVKEDKSKKNTPPVLVLAFSVFLSKIETPVGSQPIDLYFGNRAIEIVLPFK